MESRGSSALKCGGKKAAHMCVLNALSDHGIHEEVNVGLGIYSPIAWGNMRVVEE